MLYLFERKEYWSRKVENIRFSKNKSKCLRGCLIRKALYFLSASIFLDVSSSPSIPFCTWSKAILSKEVTMSCNNKERNVGFWVYCWSFVTIPIVPHFPHLFSAPSLWPFEARTGEPKLSIASCKSSEERIAVVVH